MAIKLVECVPNFSEGRDKQIIDQIAAAIRGVEGVRLLHIDPGMATNRTVMTFVGEPDAVAEGAFQAIKTAAGLIDMRRHSGEHPRMGATDVCPFIPISGISMEECVVLSKRVGQRVGDELGIPVYLYEYSASADHRRNLATIRSGEYEGIAKKITQAEWRPDFGPSQWNEQSGNTAIGARDFLIAYNVNLNTTSVRRANAVAFDVREAGRKVKDDSGNEIHQPGKCPSVKGIGWYIAEYGIAQVSMNLTKIDVTPMHVAFDACVESAHQRGMRVTGSELVGLVPLEAMLEAGRYFLRKQRRSVGVSESELIRIAIQSMGLNELSPFDPGERIIEYKMGLNETGKLASLSISGFLDETASESPAPGGGSVSALLGALGAALTAMVANLSSHKKGWDDQWSSFSDVAEKAQGVKKALLLAIDEDTAAFNRIMDAFALPKSTDEEKASRKVAIQTATRYAMEVPFGVMQHSLSCFDVIEDMVNRGNPNSLSDVGVAALCARAAVQGAFLNVRINATGCEDTIFASEMITRGEKMCEQATQREAEILKKMP
jgi:glutamate formiminotransferase/formiminotetrahydrofolate cyclodeaminase